ncbi:hypothetical protein Emag_007678 [Eimeria magna]
MMQQAEEMMRSNPELVAQLMQAVSSSGGPGAGRQGAAAGGAPPNPFAAFGSMGSMAGMFPAASADTRPPEERQACLFASQLQSLTDMGFIDRDANLAALQETNGDRPRQLTTSYSSNSSSSSSNSSESSSSNSSSSNSISSNSSNSISSNSSSSNSISSNSSSSNSSSSRSSNSSSSSSSSYNSSRSSICLILPELRLLLLYVHPFFPPHSLACTRVSCCCCCCCCCCTGDAGALSW